MESIETNIQEMSNALHFLYKKCSMSPVCMASWLKNPEFVIAITELLRQGAEIGDKEVLDIAAPILEHKNQLKKSKVRTDFEFTNARRGLNQLKRILGEQE